MLSIFSEIKTQVKPKQIARYYIGQPAKTGVTDFYNSPFRKEKTPSFAVSNTKGFTDFGTGEHYDIIGFIQKLYNLNSLDSVKKIIRDFGLRVNDNPFDEDNSISLLSIKQGLNKWRDKTYNRLCIIYRATQEAKKTLKPDTVGYLAACEFEGILDYWTDKLNSDEEKDWLQVYREIGEAWGL